MLNYLRDLYEGLMDVYRNQRDGPPQPRPVPVLTPTPSPLAPAPPEKTPVPATALTALKRWRHPFGDKSNPLQQLTQLANAVAGYYPIGVNGMWHGGVHFDSGTAGILKQDHVRCIADGEVVAYRIPGKTPKTTYFPAPGVTVAAPFASAFVLVRHRLEAPALEGSTDKPPSLIFFSLYMHLQDWESYKSNTEIKRPAFWPEGFTLRVKDTANDTALGAPNQRGLNLLHQPSRQGKAIGFLPRGATLAVTGQGDYRKLKGSKGPQGLQNDDGSLRGYIEFSRLQLSAGDVYSVAGASAALDVLAEADAKSEKLFKLPKGSEVTISGEGRFRKLESVAQYVQYASLERLRKPAVQNRVLVLETPAPIKAGELIGHLGPYQESNETSPQEKLHLEVFTADDMKSFLAASRAWAARMPASEKTWLKIAGCVPVVTHQDRFSATNPPTLFEPGSASTADLLVPKNLLDDLPPERKIQLPAADGRNAVNWYRLDHLLNDLDGNLLEGWVCEEVGVTPWVNPWSWEGYDIIVNDDPPENGLAYVMDALGLSKEEDRERNRPRIDASDKGPVKTRLYDIIDRDRNDKGSDEGGRNGKITATEMRDAIRVPAYAQSIAQLIIHYESEWYYQQSKWDALDKVLGHTTSAPMLNWTAEKERIKQLGWWGEVADNGVLPKGGKVYHLHPIGLIGNLTIVDKCACGCCLGKVFDRNRWTRKRANHPDVVYYGPVYHGTKALDSFAGWGNLISQGKATEDERSIINAMSTNEGNLDAVQAWDWQTLSAGAMQKTVTPDGYGELPIQMSEFKIENPDLFDDIFSECGWSIEVESGKPRIYYSSEDTGGRKIAGRELYDFIKSGFQQHDTGFPKESKPLASIAHAIINDEYQKKQVMDFIRRMRFALSKKPAGYKYPASDYLTTRLGRALVLDHDVNAPGNVSSDLGAAIDRLRSNHVGLGSDPNQWGVNRG